MSKVQLVINKINSWIVQYQFYLSIFFFLFSIAVLFTPIYESIIPLSSVKDKFMLYERNYWIILYSISSLFLLINIYFCFKKYKILSFISYLVFFFFLSHILLYCGYVTLINSNFPENFISCGIFLYVPGVLLLFYNLIALATYRTDIKTDIKEVKLSESEKDG